MHKVDFPADRMDTAQAAAYLGLKNKGTLEVWRATRRYQLPYIKIAARIFYRKSDLDAFIESRTVRGAA